MRKMWLTVGGGVALVAMAPASAAQDVPCIKPTLPTSIGVSFDERILDYVDCKFDSLNNQFLTCSQPVESSAGSVSTFDAVVRYIDCEALNREDGDTALGKRVDTALSRIDRLDSTVADLDTAVGDAQLAVTEASDQAATAPATASPEDVTQLRWAVLVLGVLTLALILLHVAGTVRRRKPSNASAG